LKLVHEHPHYPLAHPPHLHPPPPHTHSILTIQVHHLHQHLLYWF
jgi:hypothetical protein